MNSDELAQRFRKHIEAFDPKSEYRTRILSLFSAAVTVADEVCLRTMLENGKQRDIGRESFYEIILQSYLFLGFPRMLMAAEALGVVFGHHPEIANLSAYSKAEGEDWFERGVTLCQQVYQHNYEPLKERVEALAPDVFRWMINEGYGKVLSRPGLSVVDRELAIVACLIIDDRPKQLHSHLLGALNVGCTPELLARVIDDLYPIASEQCRMARDIVAGEVTS